MNGKLYDSIHNFIEDGRIIPNAPMKEYTTFKVGGPAEYLVKVNTSEELSCLVKSFKDRKLPYMVLGNGSNLLVSDEGIEGAVLKLDGDFLDVRCEGDKIIAGSGALLSKVCVLARDRGLSGLEFAFGIPGTVGGAMVMNAGAYDGEMALVVESVELMDEDGKIFSFSNSEMKFSYRYSVLKERKLIVLKTVYRLSCGKPDEIQAKMSDFMERRRSKQPLEFPSAGSTFKRPEGFFAGKLIMEAGLSGKRVGGACVSPKHCGFVVNDKGATAKDIYELMQSVIDTVKENSGVSLEPEVIRIGKF